jgi:hypothetical protein
MLRRKTLHLALVAVVLLAGAPASAAKKLKLAFFGFEFINTSPEPTKDEERRRIELIGNVLTDMLAKSDRFEVAPLTDAVKEKIAKSAKITGCNGCQFEWARELGADLAAWGTVQKVSNLILNENLYLESAKDERPFFSQSVDIRGNTDVSWERGIRYLVKNNLLAER